MAVTNPNLNFIIWNRPQELQNVIECLRHCRVIHIKDSHDSRSNQSSFRASSTNMLAIRLSVLLISVVLLSSGKSKTISSKPIVTRIVGGINATKVQFPYYAQVETAVRVNESTIGFANCGGSVISPTHILTAAHCVEGALAMEILLGFYTIEDASEVQSHTVKTIHAHKGFNATVRGNDIAIIELAKPINFTENIKPIQLSCNYARADTKTLVAGTGLTNDVTKETSHSLLWTNLTTMSNQQCEMLFGRIETSSICAVGKPKHGACLGDSGTALIKEENGTQIQIGILSWGVIDLCEFGFPTVFERISGYVDWIKQHSNVSCVDE